MTTPQLAPFLSIVTSMETLFVAKTSAQKNTASVQNPFGILIKSKNENAGIKGSGRNCKNEKILELKSFRSSLTTTRNVNRISSVASNLPVL